MKWVKWVKRNAIFAAVKEYRFVELQEAMGIVAECIENQQQLDVIKGLDYQAVQSFYYASTMSLYQVMQYVRTYAAE